MRSPLIDNATAELLGRIALLEQVVAELDKQIHEVKSQLSRSVAPSQLISDARAADLLGVSLAMMSE